MAIGRNSEVDFGIGITLAYFQLVGKKLVVIMLLNKYVMCGRSSGKIILTNLGCILSKPTAFDLTNVKQ